MQGVSKVRTFDVARRLFARKDFFKRQFLLEGAIRRALESPTSKAIPGEVLADIYAHWGDPLSAGAEHYLERCLAEVVNCRGDILQCGASLATLLVGAVSNRTSIRSRHVWCLEHDRHWANVVRSWLTDFAVENTHVITARPKLFEGYVWYGLESKRLPKSFRLAFCDGGRASTRGVIGLVHRIGHLLAPEAVILASNVFGAEDLTALKTWASERNANCVIIDKKEGLVRIAPAKPGKGNRIG